MLGEIVCSAWLWIVNYKGQHSNFRVSMYTAKRFGIPLSAYSSGCMCLCKKGVLHRLMVRITKWDWWSGPGARGRSQHGRGRPRHTRCNSFWCGPTLFPRWRALLRRQRTNHSRGLRRFLLHCGLFGRGAAQLALKWLLERWRSFRRSKLM